MELYVCPWCNKSLPDKDHTVTSVLDMYLIGCPQYVRLEPTFLNKELYKINSVGRIKI
jgi:hypothetical protein